MQLGHLSDITKCVLHALAHGICAFAFFLAVYALKAVYTLTLLIWLKAVYSLKAVGRGEVRLLVAKCIKLVKLSQLGNSFALPST